MALSWKVFGPERRGALRFGLLLLAGLSLSSCGGGATPETFDLGAPKQFSARAPRGQLAIAEPTATLPVDSDRIVVRTGPEAVAYLTGAQWADRLPRLVQTQMIAAFENARAFRSVGRPGLNADNNLVSEIRRFEIDVTTGQAMVELSVKLAGDSSGRVRAAKIITATVPAPSKGGAAMAAALDAALEDCLRQLVTWTTSQI